MASQRRMSFVLTMAALLFRRTTVAVHATEPVPYLSWVTGVVLPNQTVLASGSGLVANCVAEVNTTSEPVSSLLLPPSIAAGTSFMVTLPASLRLDIYTFRVLCIGGVSRVALVNQARPFWVQGNCGNESTPGGTVRLFGTGLSLAPSARLSGTIVESLRLSAMHALQVSDYATLSKLTAKLTGIASASEQSDSRTTLRLKGVVSTISVEISAQAETLSEYHAQFLLPPTIPAGEYVVSVSNSLGGAAETFGQLGFFEGPTRPLVQTIVVRAAVAAPDSSDPRTFQEYTICCKVGPHVFDVTHFGSHGRMPPPEGQPPIDASKSIRDAVSAAAAMGGGTVYFPRGQYFLVGVFEIPDGVYLKGERQDLVSLFWYEQNITNHERAMFVGVQAAGAGPSDKVTWGMADLTLYASAFYYNIIMDGPTLCNNKAPPYGCTSLVRDFQLHRVRIRADAYFASGGPFTTGRPRPNVGFNFSQSQTQGVVLVSGVNWRVEDCDILGTGQIFWSGGSAGGFGGTSYGLLRGNTIRNGGGALGMDQWKQVIVENNAISGASLASGGNYIASYNGGYAQHVAFLNNSVSHVWGGDREVITYDNAGGAWFGALAASSGKRVVATGDRLPLNRTGTNSSATGGGWVVVGGALLVLNGTGAGQIRRVVDNPSPREWILDAPLDAVGLAGSAAGPSFVQVLPFRGRNIFHHNRLSDVGAFQFYGIGLENVVSENVNSRMAGMVSWGQWRGWNPERYRRDIAAGKLGGHLGGEMGCGANPNLRNVFERNEFVEGNSIVNYNTPEGANYNFGGG